MLKTDRDIEEDSQNCRVHTTKEDKTASGSLLRLGVVIVTIAGNIVVVFLEVRMTTTKIIRVGE